MDAQIVQNVKELINYVSSKFDSMVPIMSVLVSQHALNGLINAIVFGSLAIFFITMGIIMIRKFRATTLSSDDFPLWLVGGIVFFVFGFMGIFATSDAIQQFLNPELNLFMKILTKIK